AAMGRFEKRKEKRRFLAALRPGSNDEPYDAGLFVIDLIARLVVSDSTYDHADREGQIAYHDGDRSTDVSIDYHLPDVWLLLPEREAGRGWAADRRMERAAPPPRDHRLVIYGRPMLEHMARGVFAAFARREEHADQERARWDKQVRQWL